jgi:hypothetical protein
MAWASEQRQQQRKGRQAEVSAGVGKGGKVCPATLDGRCRRRGDVLAGELAGRGESDEHGTKDTIIF